MRVFHVITTIERGGAEKQLLILVREQISLGYEVEIIYLKGKPELEREFLESGASVNHLLLGKNFLLQIPSLRDYEKGKSGIFHAHLPRAELLTALSLKKSAYVVSRHNSEPFMPGFPKFLSSFLSRGVTRCSSGVIAISHAVKKYILKRDEVSKNAQVEVILYGAATVNNNQIQGFSRRQFGISDSDFIIGTIGRLAPQKDYPTLLNAFQIFKTSHPNAKLIIVGGGPEEAKLKEFANQLGLRDAISWLGRVSNVEELMNLFDVFVLTSIYEGFGLVFLEAMAQGLPIVSTNHSSVPEVLGTNYPLLARVGDSQDVAEKISLILEEETRNQIREKLRDRLALFNPTAMAKKIDSLYTRILKEQ
jgi:glycosyltransferase involved in cell wall biosynthesis